MGTVRVVLISMNKLFRQGLRSLLDPCEFAVAGEGRDFAEVEALFREEAAPDLVVVDLHGRPERDFRELSQLSSRYEGLRIVVLANELSLQDMAGSLRAGADAYLVNELSGEAFSLSLKLVMKGEKVFPSSLVSVFAKGSTLFDSHAWSGDPKNLTEREKQILQCLLNGHSNKHIARALEISEGTVKVHLKSLMKKISADNRTQAALWARNHGIGGDLQQFVAA
ncbi:MAG: LuxR C-terminal-related transcriptional regulator [Geminicoccaceae bacterium]